MAEQTTSSITRNEMEKPLESSLKKPKVSEVELVNDLAKSLNESYLHVKKHQALYKEICSNNPIEAAKRRKMLSAITENKENKDNKMTNTLQTHDDNLPEWQEVFNNKNKLKRKKKLSASLTSVNDSVNQEKRTRIEGIQLNCRGKLQIKDTQKNLTQVTSNQGTASLPKCSDVATPKTEKLTTKPPIPPTHTKNSANPEMIPPPRLKRKIMENIQTIQKLQILSDQLRLEINDLKSNLSSEKGAVRVLR